MEDHFLHSKGPSKDPSPPSTSLFQFIPKLKIMVVLAPSAIERLKDTHFWVIVVASYSRRLLTHQTHQR